MTGGGPLLTTSATALPFGTVCPALGVIETTEPDGTFLSYAAELVTFSPAFCSAATAGAAGLPTKFGSFTGAGPRDTTRATDWSRLRFVDAAGSS